MKKPFLSVVIPAYNEAKNFERGKLNDVYTFLQKQGFAFELILVDDGSSDETAQLLKTFAKGKDEVRAIINPHQGKALTVKAGMLAATGENRLYADFDQSTPIGEVSRLLQKRSEGYDIAIGSREVFGAQRESEPWYRHIMGKGFNFVVQLFTIRGIKDTQCGFKLLSGEATEYLFPKLTVTAVPKPDAFTGAFDVELLYLAKRAGFAIAEVPIYWKHVKTERVAPFKDSLRMFWQVLKIRLADWQRMYEA